MRFVYTLHASTMLEERAIDKAWIERTILYPDTVEPDPQHPEMIRAFRVVPERDGRVLRVVYVPSELTCRVTTLFLDRSRRR